LTTIRMIVLHLSENRTHVRILGNEANERPN
jgi:hypothetical protein